MSCEPSRLVIPAGLPNTVDASLASAALPAAAVPRSGVPISYSQKPAAIAEGDDSTHPPAASTATQAIRTRLGKSITD
jgi:hypothetical protein